MLEWLKRHAWKACIPQKGIRGSNPRLSAIPAEFSRFFVFSNHEKSATHHLLINIGKTKMNVRNFPKQMMKALK